MNCCGCIGLMELAPKQHAEHAFSTKWAKPNSVSNETFEVLVTFDEANGARSWELHAGLAQCISGSEVIFWVNLNGDHTLSTLDTCSGSDVLSERTSHTLGHTVCTGASCLLVFTKHVVGEGVDSKSVALSPSLLTDGRIRNNTGCFERSVTDLHVVVGAQFEDDRELARLSSNTVSDVVLVDSVVRDTTDKLASGVRGSLQSAIHGCRFACHNELSKQPCDQWFPYHPSASAFAGHTASRSNLLPHYEGDKRIHVLHSFARFMAKGWRGYLEEESEYQWVAMAGFFIFILLGAVAIQGTTNLPGVAVGAQGASHDGARVLNIVYSDDTSFTAQIVTADGTDLYQQNGDSSVVELMSSSVGSSADDIRFITLLENGNVVFSPQENTIQVVHTAQNEPAGEVLISTIQMDNGTGEFDVHDLAETSNGETTSWMMITDENEGTSIRGFGSITSTSSSANTIATSMSDSVLSYPLVNSAGVVWQKIAPLSGELWGASGYLSFISTGAGANPASPALLPVVAVIEWDGTQTAPSIKTIHTGDEGQVHTLIALTDSTVFAAGTEESTVISSDGELTQINTGSVAAVADHLDRVWLFGDIGSESILRMTGLEEEVVSLARPLAFTTEASGFGTHVIHLHGLDEMGEVKTLTIDTSAAGSIESGRGFLNLMFLGVCTVIMSVMAWSASGKLKRMKKI